jgi:hypothetical protein
MSVDRDHTAWLCACLLGLWISAPALAEPPAKPKPAPVPRTAAAKPDAGTTDTRAHPTPQKKPEDEAVVKNLELLMIMEMLKDYDLLDDSD